MLQAELKILGGKHQGKMIPLNSKKFLVGREQDCHLRPNSDLVSRHHCVFSIDDYAIRLRDLGSTNGTLVNGTNLRGEVILKAGDRVTIGKLELEVNIRQSAASGVSTKSSMPPAPPASIPVVSDTPTPSEEVETSYELAVYPPAQPVEAAAEIPADTAIFAVTPPQYAQSGAPNYPQGYPPQMMPPGYGMPGGYMPPQYPQYPPGYGQPPGYGGPPPGYGQPMSYPMGYPQMMPMPQGYPGAAAASPAVAVAEPVPEAPADAMAVRLPKPEETGAKLAGPAVGSGGSGGSGAKEEKPSTTAADIIKQYMNRRT